MADWLPDNHLDLKTLVELIEEFFENEANRVRVGFQTANEEDPPSVGERSAVPQSVTTIGTWYFNVYLPKAVAYKAAYVNWEEYSKRAPEDRVRLADAEKAIKPELRYLHNILKAVPGVTNNDLLEMGFPVRHDSTHNPPAMTDSFPVPAWTSIAEGVLKFTFKDSKSGKAGKPRNIHGILARHAVLYDEPQHRDDLVEKVFSTTSTIILRFDLSMLGKTLYLTACWENNTGHHGEYCPIIKVIIS
jgi:hypothetical protein